MHYKKFDKTNYYVGYDRKVDERKDYCRQL